MGHYIYITPHLYHFTPQTYHAIPLPLPYQRARRLAGRPGPLRSQTDATMNQFAPRLVMKRHREKRPVIAAVAAARKKKINARNEVLKKVRAETRWRP